MRRTATALVLAAAAALLLAGCAETPAAGGGPEIHSIAPSASPTISVMPATAASCAKLGVFVTVRFGILRAADVNLCAKTTEPITAAAALDKVGISVAGTQKYGDQVVCRVNGVPSASKPIDVPGHDPYSETCASMPAAYAYWAVWVRDSPTGTWDYAASSITSQQLKPGQTLGLKFTTGADTAPPQG
jgi:predicted small secreted protein